MKFLLNKNTKLFLVVSLFTVMISFTVFFSVEQKAQASAGAITGYAWSGNIGWISMNCTNTNSCGTSNYGVNIDSSGNVAGYAWSSNIGWIKFGGFSSFPPAGSGTIAANAHATGNNITGWARACAGLNNVTSPQINQTTPNLSCTGVSRTDGWDGWISLSGTGYGVSDSSAGAITGYAWGSDVVGWIQFNASSTATPPPGGTLTLMANGSTSPITSPITVASGTAITLTATGTNIDASVGGTANSSVGDVTTADWTGTNKLCPADATTSTFSPTITVTNTGSSVKSYTFTLQCTVITTMGGGFVASNNVVVNVNPAASAFLTLMANNSSVPITVASGSTITLSAMGSGLGIKGPGTIGAGTPANTNWTGSPQPCPSGDSPTTYVPSFSVTNPSTTTDATYTYTLTCSKTAGGNISSTATVVVQHLPVLAVILKAYHDSAFSSLITSPLSSSGGDVYLLWSSTNADSCVSSNSNLPVPTSLSYPGWSGVSQTPNAINSSSMFLTETATFKMTCVNGATSASFLAPVQVGSAPGDGPAPGCPALGVPPCPKKQPHFIEQ